MSAEVQESPRFKPEVAEADLRAALGVACHPALVDLAILDPGGREHDLRASLVAPLLGGGEPGVLLALLAVVS